jgi:dihydroorotase
MMDRRQILCSAAASAAMLARIPSVRAATYDLLIKGGRVIDPSVRLDGIRDVAIAGGRIVAVEAGIAGDATETIDAGGKIVAPGLIDIHTHAGRGKDSPALALQDGVTGFVDAGSGGPDNIDEIAAVVRGGPQIGRALLNIATRTGFTGGELMDINRANVSLARGAIARRRGQGAAVGKRRRHQRSRGAAPRPGGRLGVRPAGNDPHRPVGFADEGHSRAAQTGRHRHAHVFTAAERYSR